MAKSLVSEILKRAEEIPSKPAFIFLGINSRRTVLTFGDVSNLAQKFAAVLRDKGIGDGDVVCNTLASSPERLITQLGITMAGAICLNGQVCLADGSDFLKSLNDGRVKAIIYNPNDSRGAYKVLKDRITPSEDPGKMVCADIPSLELLIPCILDSSKGMDKSLFEELKDVKKRTCIDRGPNAVVAYLCTSGSTGIFKLVPCTDEFLLQVAHEMSRLIGITQDSIVLNDKAFGWIVGIPDMVFALGCTRITIEDTIPRDEVYFHIFKEALRQEKCTSTLLVPSLLDNLIENAEKNPDQNRHLLRSVGVLGAPVMKRALRAIGSVVKSIVILYGGTETGVSATMTLTDCTHDFEDFMCGWPLEEAKFRIVNSKMVDLPQGQTGDILVKKKTLTSTHYVNNVKATKETFLPGGWIRLGDRGFFNSKGQLSVLGRGAHAIMRGDDIIYPGQLEAPILQCPGLAEVIITGVPDPDKLEEMCALLVRQSHVGNEVDEAYVRRFCVEKLFVNPDNPEFNPIPKYFRFVEAIPKLNTGKDDRAACKLLAAKLVSKGILDPLKVCEEGST